MALVVKDRVKEATTTTGTGTISLDGAATGFQTFVAGIGTTNTTYYAIVDNNTGDYEVGIGTITDATPDTLSRDTILESSNAGSAVNLQAGTKDVFCTYPAEKSVYLDSSGQLILDGTAITATASELNFVDGVTSSIQTQIDSFANSLEGVKNDYVYTATASQTVFSGADDNTNTLVIDLAGLVNVFLNGVRLIRDTDYTVSAAGDSITLTTGATVNDLLEVEVFGNFTGQSGAEVGITGGLIDGVDIGNTTAGDGTFVDLTATGTTTLAGASTSADITFGDNDKAIFGAGSDLQIYHDAVNNISVIEDVGSGILSIRGSSNIDFVNSANTKYYARFIDAGAASLYYDNSPKLATTNAGIDVTGTVTADGLTVDGTADVDNLIIDNAGKISSVGQIELQVDTDNNQSGTYIGFSRNNTTSERLALFSENGDISFYEDTGATAKFFWDAADEHLFVGDNTTNMPSSVTGAGLMITGTSPTGVDGGQLVIKSSELTTTAGNGSGIVFDNYNGVGNRVFGAIQVLKENSTSNNNDSFMRFTTRSNSTGLAEAMRIDSSGNVGIGDATYGANLGQLRVINNGTSSPASISLMGYGNVANNAEVGKLEFAMQEDGFGGQVHAKISAIANGTSENNAHLAFYTSAGTLTERMRLNSDGSCRWTPDGTTADMTLDASGNLLVGKTNTSFATAGTTIYPSSGMDIVRSGGACLSVNRTTSDGSIIDFYKDGAPVGSIGTVSGDLTIGTGDTGLAFNDFVDAIYPVNASGANRDNAVTLGDSAIRFKDLYLSGGVYLGGTGSANHLDDYEEGTFNPTISSGISSAVFSTQSGAYTKVGNLVSFAFRISLTAGTGNSNRVEIGGLPFTSSTTVSGSNGVATLAYSSAVFDTTEATTFYIAGNATRVEFYNRDGASFIGTQINVPASFNVNLVGFYYTAS